MEWGDGKIPENNLQNEFELFDVPSGSIKLQYRSVFNEFFFIDYGNMVLVLHRIALSKLDFMISITTTMTLSLYL